MHENRFITRFDPTGAVALENRLSEAIFPSPTFADFFFHAGRN